jgi:predicted  nucleic acid-binding Zn-ribbon protein
MQGRLIQLNGQKNNLVLRLQFISETRKQLSKTVSQLYTAAANSGDYRELEAQVSVLGVADRQLEMDSREVDNELAAIENEIATLQADLEATIGSAFRNPDN